MDAKDFNFLQPKGDEMEKRQSAGLIVGTLIRLLAERLLSINGNKYGFPGESYFIAEAESLQPYMAVGVIPSQTAGVYTYTAVMSPSKSGRPFIELGFKLVAFGDSNNFNLFCGYALPSSIALDFDENGKSKSKLYGDEDPPTEITIGRDAFGNPKEEGLRHQLERPVINLLERFWENQHNKQMAALGGEVVEHLHPMALKSRERMAKATEIFRSAIDE